MLGLNMTLLEIINVIIEMSTILIYCDGAFERRSMAIGKKIALFIGVVIAFCFTSMLYLPSFANMLLAGCVCFLFSSTLYHGSMKKRIYAVLLYLLFIIVSDTVATAILSSVFHDSYAVIPEENSRPIGMALCAFSMFAFCLVGSRIFSRKIRELPLRQWIFIMLCPLVSFAIIRTIDLLLIKSNSTELTLIFLPIISLMYINFAAFDFFETYSNQLKLKVMEELAEKTEENYKLLQNTEEEMRILKHDFKNHVQAIQFNLANNNMQTAQEHLASFQKKVDDISYVVYTRNSALDSALNIEGRRAKAEGIDYCVKILTKTQLHLDPADICTIFFNALDNAIEACKQCQQKFISVTIAEKEGRLQIRIDNSSVPVKTNEHSILPTTKQNKALHGYGLKSMKAAVKKYNGLVDTNYEDGVFSLKLLFDNQKS